MLRRACSNMGRCLARRNSKTACFGESTTAASAAAIQPAQPHYMHRFANEADLADFCLDLARAAIFKPLLGTLRQIRDLATLQAHEALPGTVRTSLIAVSEFLESAGCRKVLEGALRALDGAAQEFALHMETLLTILGHECPVFGSTEDLLRNWRCGFKRFMLICEEIRELHLYFVFLDVKGDRCLLEQVALRLCGTLGISPEKLGGHLLCTRPWVEEALRTLAHRAERDLLEKHHAAALTLFMESWQARVPLLSTDLGMTMWSQYFDSVKVVWPAFAEAFQDFVVRESMPVDMMWALQALVDPEQTQAVCQDKWRRLLGDFRSMQDLMQSLLETVQQRRTAVYRTDCQRVSPPEQIQVKKLDWKVKRPTIEEEPCVKGRDRSISDVTDAGFTIHSEPRVEVELQSYAECLHTRAWWKSLLYPGLPTRELELAALASVTSNICLTDQALVLRVVRGELSQSKPQLLTNLGTISKLPALLITANGSRFNGVTKFGRAHLAFEHLKDCGADHVMPEAIASRSHFNIRFDQKSNGFQIMDGGSKWGTFLNIGHQKTALQCGDMYRIGSSEFVIRYCGGSCLKCRKGGKRPLSFTTRSAEVPSSCPPFWESLFSSACKHSHVLSPLTGSGSAPGRPLEIDFISGSMAGRRVILRDRICTLGRSEGATVQVTEAVSGNISRIHSIFEYIGDCWHISDNDSTNGTWRRIAFVLSPSLPVPLEDCACIMAAGHEFLVEKVKVEPWLPSTATAVLEKLSAAQRLERTASSSRFPETLSL